MIGTGTRKNPLSNGRATELTHFASRPFFATQHAALAKFVPTPRADPALAVVTTRLCPLVENKTLFGSKSLLVREPV